jgi:hypothetical protein
MIDLGKFAFLRKHALHFLIAAIALVLFSLALFAHKQAQQTLTEAKNSYAQQQATNQDAEQSAALLNEYLGVYRQLQEQGVIAQPQRLQWLEALKESVIQHTIPALNFILSRSETATETNTVYKHESIAIKVTPLKLELTLLHESDFYRLLNALQVQAKGLFSADKCSITRMDTGNEYSERRITADFNGRCDLLWYSLADITQSWEVATENVSALENTPAVNAKMTQPTFAHLFTSPEQRRRFDAIRRQGGLKSSDFRGSDEAPAPVVEQAIPLAPQPIKLAGILWRADGKHKIWLSGAGVVSSRNILGDVLQSANLKVPLQGENYGAILKPGQVWVGENRRVEEAYRQAAPKTVAASSAPSVSTEKILTPSSDASEVQSSAQSSEK